jgi:hypothetical protein
VKSLPLATIYEVKIPLRKWKKSLLQRNPAQMTSAIAMSSERDSFAKGIFSTFEKGVFVRSESWRVAKIKVKNVNKCFNSN